jgi:prepilin-type N-terminal cleavage/methylation domain-containing protein
MCNLKKQGFTLVELSIVIIIIGFLIAGISAGTSLIRQAKLSTIISDQQSYFSALNTFRDRYSYYPGDLPTASAYWPTAINGNGDGLVQLFYEGFNAWHHLQLSGILLSINLDNNINENEPISRIDQNVVWRIESNSDNIYSIPANTRNSLQILGLGSEFLTTAEASMIDTKIDDGKPSDGNVYAIDDFNTGSIVEADGVTTTVGIDLGSGNYASTAAKYNLSFTQLGISRLYFYLPQ